MRYEFTPASDRALQTAAGWSSCANSNDLRLPEVLIGLLEEPECRAALLLAEHGVDLLALREKWNALTAVDDRRTSRATRFSAELDFALRSAQSRLFDYPQPLALATEHILLGILSGESDAAAWLRSRGMDADAVEAAIHRANGHDRSPLQWPEEETNPATASAVSPAACGLSDNLPIPALRILDAAANRASEGLRVIEDYVRFVLDDRHLTGQLKSLRHELTDALSRFETTNRLAARESQADVGATTKTPSEFSRPDFAAIVTASFQRLQQALRSLEEYAKLADAGVAARLEKLRYQTYTLERAVDVTRSSLERLADARLYVLVDARPTETDFQSLVKSLIAADVSIIQLREKSLDDRTLLARARLLRQLTRGTQTLFIMNDRPDLAVLADADGVHIGQDELPVKDARTIVGPNRLVGVSTHSIEQARQAVLDGASYIGVGPTFPSGTKYFAEFSGLSLVRAVNAEIRLPSFAIGGITRDNLPEVLTAGATRVAVSGAIIQTSDPGNAAADLLRAFRDQSL